MDSRLPHENSEVRSIQADGDALRNIAFVWMSEYGLGTYEASAKSLSNSLDGYF